VRAASRSSCARQNLIRRYAAKTQHNSGFARTGGPVPHSSKINAHSADVRFGSKADIATGSPNERELEEALASNAKKRDLRQYSRHKRLWHVRFTPKSRHWLQLQPN
jgi:hypothetical protein